MKFCILIEISKEKISFLYNRSDGESKFAPFVGDGSALPLAVYCYGNDIQIGQYAIDEAKNKNPNAYTPQVCLPMPILAMFLSLAFLKNQDTRKLKNYIP